MRIGCQHRQIVIDCDFRNLEINRWDGPSRASELSTQAPEMTRSGLVEWLRVAAMGASVTQLLDS